MRQTQRHIGIIRTRREGGGLGGGNMAVVAKTQPPVILIKPGFSFHDSQHKGSRPLGAELARTLTIFPDHLLDKRKGCPL